jgi:hypothetical protein
VSPQTGECEHCPYGWYLTSPPLPRSSYSPTSLGLGLGLVMGGILAVSFAIFAHYCYVKHASPKTEEGGEVEGVHL